MLWCCGYLTKVPGSCSVRGGETPAWLWGVRVQVLWGQRPPRLSRLLIPSLHWTPGFQRILVEGVVVKRTSSSDSRYSIGWFLALKPKCKLSLEERESWNSGVEHVISCAMKASGRCSSQVPACPWLIGIIEPSCHYRCGRGWCQPGSGKPLQWGGVTRALTGLPASAWCFPSKFCALHVRSFPEYSGRYSEFKVFWKILVDAYHLPW